MRLPNSALATQPASDVSSKYQFISTNAILKTFQEHGWEPVAANEARVRKAAYQGFQKHVVRLRQAGSCSNNGPYDRLEGMPEIVVVNSHNRGSSVKIMAGIFRMVCSNGLIVADSVFESQHIRHVGYAAHYVVEAIEQVERSLELIMSRIEAFRAIPMTMAQAEQFALSACALRWEEGKFPHPQALLALHRFGDNLNTLWNVLNVVQENMLRGRRSRARSMRYRGITGIDQNVSINQGIWQLAEDFARPEPIVAELEGVLV